MEHAQDKDVVVETKMSMVFDPEYQRCLGKGIQLAALSCLGTVPPERHTTKAYCVLQVLTRPQLRCRPLMVFRSIYQLESFEGVLIQQVLTMAYLFGRISSLFMASSPEHPVIKAKLENSL